MKYEVTGPRKPDSLVLASVAAIVFIAALWLYIRTLAPTITWAHNGTDGGELTAAAATLGVAHPPGYPTYVTLGYLFAQLPIGNVAYRLNVMSAVCMALAAALTTLGIFRAIDTSPLSLTWLTRAGVAIIGGLTFAVAPMVWGQATIAEVHALNALFAATLIYLLTPTLFRNEAILPNQFAIALFVWGLGLGNLATLIALAPLIFFTWRRLAAGNQHLVFSNLQFAIAFLLGLSVYLLVPIRAGTHPPVNWGNAVNVPNFIAQITAEMYRGYVFAVPLDHYPQRLIAFAQLLVAQFGWPGVLAGAIGLQRALISPNKNWRRLALPIGLYALFALSYNTIDSDLYLIPVWLFGAWAVACGSLRLIHWVSSRFFVHSSIRILHPSSLILLLLMIFGPIWIIVTQFNVMDLSADRTAEDFAHTALAAAPDNAILITSNDGQTSSLWYYRGVETQRQDIAIIDARLAGYEWYTPAVLDQGHAPNMPPFDPEATWRVRLAAANPTRPVCEIDPDTQEMTCPNGVR